MTLERAAVALEPTFNPAESVQHRCVVREVMRRAERGLKTILVVGASPEREAAGAARAEAMGPLADPLAKAIVLNAGAIEAAALLSRSLAAMGVSVAQLDARVAAPPRRATRSTPARGTRTRAGTSGRWARWT